MNKRGAELSVNTIILIIIGVLILAFIIFGFVTGWKIFSGLFKKDNNVQDLVQDCDSACNVYASQFDYCLKERTLTVDKADTSGVTCYWLENKKATLGFKSCISVDCKNAGIYESEDAAKADCISGIEKNLNGNIKVLIDKAPKSTGSIYKTYGCIPTT